MCKGFELDVRRMIGRAAQPQSHFLLFRVMGVGLGRAGGGAGRLMMMKGLWNMACQALLARLRSSEYVFMQENIQEADF